MAEVLENIVECERYGRRFRAWVARTDVGPQPYEDLQLLERSIDGASYETDPLRMARGVAARMGPRVNALQVTDVWTDPGDARTSGCVFYPEWP